MRKVNRPNNTNAINDLKTALTYKDGTAKYILKITEIETIKHLYEKYEDLKGVANDDFKSINLTPTTNHAIYNAYSEIQEKNRLEKLRARILLSVERCPYCGISAADELDHHLPRSIYKALSVYASNLIPLCHKCNNKKRTITGEKIEERFTHVYYDEFPDFPILVADVSFDNNTLVFNFKIDGSKISELRFKQLSFQIKKINLNKRLEREINVYLSSYAVSLELVYGDGNSDGVKILLNKQSEVNKNIFGINDWRTALLIPLANCDEFCNGGFKEYFKKVEGLVV